MFYYLPYYIYTIKNATSERIFGCKITKKRRTLQENHRKLWFFSQNPWSVTKKVVPLHRFFG
jgi:hypothetical protein